MSDHDPYHPRHSVGAPDEVDRLKAELREAKEQRDHALGWRDRSDKAEARADDAEAEVARLNSLLSQSVNVKQRLHEDRKTLQAENAKLRAALEASGSHGFSSCKCRAFDLCVVAINEVVDAALAPAPEAERKACCPDAGGWNCHGQEEEKIKRLVCTAMGAGSLCWDPKPTGVFDSTTVTQIANKLVAEFFGYCTKPDCACQPKPPDSEPEANTTPGRGATWAINTYGYDPDREPIDIRDGLSPSDSRAYANGYAAGYAQASTDKWDAAIEAAAQRLDGICREVVLKLKRGTK